MVISTNLTKNIALFMIKTMNTAIDCKVYITAITYIYRRFALSLARDSHYSFGVGSIVRITVIAEKNTGSFLPRFLGIIIAPQERVHTHKFFRIEGKRVRARNHRVIKNKKEESLFACAWV